MYECIVKVLGIDRTRGLLADAGGFRQVVTNKANELQLLGHIQRIPHDSAIVRIIGTVIQHSAFSKWLIEMKSTGFFKSLLKIEDNDDWHPSNYDSPVAFEIIQSDNLNAHRGPHSDPKWDAPDLGPPSVHSNNSKSSADRGIGDRAYTPRSVHSKRGSEAED